MVRNVVDDVQREVSWRTFVVAGVELFGAKAARLQVHRVRSLWRFSVSQARWHRAAAIPTTLSWVFSIQCTTIAIITLKSIDETIAHLHRRPAESSLSYHSVT